jgi:hypothetical protein
VATLLLSNFLNFIFHGPPGLSTVDFMIVLGPYAKRKRKSRRKSKPPKEQGAPIVYQKIWLCLPPARRVSNITHGERHLVVNAAGRASVRGKTSKWSGRSADRRDASSNAHNKNMCEPAAGWLLKKPYTATRHPLILHTLLRREALCVIRRVAAEETPKIFLYTNVLFCVLLAPCRLFVYGPRYTDWLLSRLLNYFFHWSPGTVSRAGHRKKLISR